MRLASVTLLLLTPVFARAEPGVSMKHIPYLWGFATVVAMLVSLLPFVIAKRGSYFQTAAKKWGWSIALFVLFMVFAAPIIVVFGSIVITGRTM